MFHTQKRLSSLPHAGFINFYVSVKHHVMIKSNHKQGIILCQHLSFICKQIFRAHFLLDYLDILTTNMQWSECLCYICLKNFVDKERKNTCIKRAVRFVFTWRTKVPDATTDRNCLISLILSSFDALWTTAQYVQGCQQDHLWCRHYCNKTVENFFFKMNVL